MEPEPTITRSTKPSGPLPKVHTGDRRTSPGRDSPPGSSTERLHAATTTPPNHVLIDIAEQNSPSLFQPTGVGLRDIIERFNEEKNRWSQSYLNDPDFKRKVDGYVQARADLMARIDDGGMTCEEIMQGAKELGTRLAYIYGMADANGWTAETRRSAHAAGHAYAEPSIKSNWVNQTPGIFRSVAGAIGAACAVAHPHAAPVVGQVRSGINLFYATVQIAFTFFGPVWGASAQSTAVAKQAQSGPEFSPNVNSSQRVAETGQAVPIIPVAEVKKNRRQIEKTAARKNRYRDRTDSEAKLASMRIQHQGKLERLTSKLEVHGNQDKAASSDKSRLDKVKREINVQRILLRLLDDDPVDLDDIRREKAMEEAISRLYVQLNVMPSQATNRGFRSFNNINAGIVPLAANAAVIAANLAWTFSPTARLSLDALSIGLGLIQGSMFHHDQGDAAAADFMAKMATQFQIIALTGTGKITGADGAVNPARLDNMVKGRLRVRLDHLAQVLEYDNKVYKAALMGYLADPDADYADPGSTATLTVQTDAMEDAQTIVRTYEALLASFEACAPKDQAQWLQSAAASLGLPDEEKGNLLQIHALYAANAKAVLLAKQGKLDELLNPDTQLLTPQTRDILLASMRCALRSKPTREDVEGDDALARAKGCTEKYSSTGSVNQTAQKLGQALAYWVCGSASPNLVRAVGTLIVEGIDIANDGDGTMASYGLRAATASLSIAGSLVAIPLGFGYHKFIAQKNLHRQRDQTENRTAAPNSGLVHISDRDFLNWLSMAYLRSYIDNFKTLLAPRIPAQALRDAHRVRYQGSSSLTSDTFEQIFSTDLGVMEGRTIVLQRLFGFFKAQYGSLDGKTLNDLALMNESHVRNVLVEESSDGNEPIAPGSPAEGYAATVLPELPPDPQDLVSEGIRHFSDPAVLTATFDQLWTLHRTISNAEYLSQLKRPLTLVIAAVGNIDWKSAGNQTLDQALQKINLSHDADDPLPIPLRLVINLIVQNGYPDAVEVLRACAADLLHATPEGEDYKDARACLAWMAA